jgi:NtrC-family two-component system sensor histidine kinase KinB
MDLPTRDAYNSLHLLIDISRELVSALDLATVLQRVLSRSLEIVEANSASIIILNENEEPVDAAIIVDGEVHEDTVDRLKSTLESGLAGWVVRNRQSVLVDDTSKDPRWTQRGYDGEYQEGPKSSLCAPLIARDQLVGVITFTHYTPKHYDQSHSDLVQAIADQAAIAALNAQLYEASQRRADVMSTLAETAAAVTSTLDFDEVLDRILEQTSQALEVEVVLLGLVDKKNKEVVLQAVWGENPPREPGHRLRLDQGVAGWVARNGKTVVVPDVKKDQYYSIDPELDNNFDLKAIAASPIMAEGEIVGVLEAVNPRAEFSPDDVLLLKGISSLAGTAIQHARLFNETQLAHSRYRQLFEDNIDLIFLSDWEGRILEANREAIEFGFYSREELNNMKMFHLGIVDWNMVGINFQDLKTGERKTYESVFQPKTGPILPVVVHVHQVTMEDQSGLQWIVRDITELKKLERMREDLTSMIYHDLRSPLANVVSGLDLIKSMVPEEYGVGSVVNIAERSVNRVQRLVSSLLDTSRLQAGQKILNPSPVIVQNLVNEAVETIKPAAEASNFALTVTLPEEPATLLADVDMIRRVMINILENALKYSTQGRRVYVDARVENDMLFFSVKDEGRGISKQDQKIIFERYMRADLTAKNTKGLGLGLAFSKLAVESHGGEIWVESELGQGSTFTFKIPLVTET